MGMPTFRRSWAAVALVVAAAFLHSATPARAQAADAYTVRDVEEDVTAENVNVARQQAFDEAQKKAFQTLLQRLTVPADWPRLPEVSGDELNNLVLDVGVDQEKRSSVRYIATLSVRFKPEAVRRLLRAANIPYVEWRGRPVVVLPVLKADTGPVLWESPNPWRTAWKSGASQGLVPLTVPAPPTGPEAQTDALQAATAGSDVLAAFAQRYNTPDILVATATVTPQADAKTINLDVALTGTGPLAGTVSGSRSYQGQAGEPADAVMRRAVLDVTNTLDDTYKSGNVLQFDHTATLEVTVPLAGIEDWSAIRDKLARTPAVRDWQVTALSRSSASLVLDYAGEQQQLSAVLMQNGLVLSWAEDHWQLQNVIANPAAGAGTQ